MPSASPEMLRLALLGAAVLLLIVVIQWRLRAWFTRRKLAARFVKARRGESRGRELLEASGYAVLGAQCVQSYALFVDGKEMQIALRADYIVKRDGLRYVAEVKTGAYAPTVRTPATRRQLLEYRMAFDVDGALLVDAEEQRIHVVRFPLSETAHAERLSPLGWIVIGAGVAALVALQWR